MKINNITYSPAFKSNARTYRTNNGNIMCTMTSLHRGDLDWEKFTNFAIEHFKDKENVQFIQFASSDGSEAYTQILSFLDKYPEKVTDKFLPIQAYDIDKEMVTAAKSGLINITEEDRKRFPKNYEFKFSDCFKRTDKELWINNDSLQRITHGGIYEYYDYITPDDWVTYRTYEVNDFVKSKVNFNIGDMFDIMLKHNDNSNSIIMCRNVLTHMNQKQVDYFTDLLSRKLKKDSLLVIGGCDKSTVYGGDYLEKRGFQKVMKHVYKKLEHPSALYNTLHSTIGKNVHIR